MIQHDLFISHSSGDAGVARELRARLEAAGYSCWMAPDDVIGTSPWAAQILAAIQGSRAMLVLISANANASPHVSREVNLAVGRGRPVVPIRIEDVDLEASLEYLLSLMQRVDAFPLPLDAHVGRILRRLSTVVPLQPGAGGTVPETTPTPREHVAAPATVIAGPTTVVGRRPSPITARVIAWARSHGALTASILTLAALLVVGTGALALGSLPRPSPSQVTGIGPDGSPGATASAPGVADSPSPVPSLDGSAGPSSSPASTVWPSATPPPAPTPTPDNKAPTGAEVAFPGDTVYGIDVDLTTKAVGATEMRFGNATTATGSCEWGSWIAYSTTSAWTIPGGTAGPRWVCAQFRDASQNTTGTVRDEAYFDHRPVATPGTFDYTSIDPFTQQAICEQIAAAGGIVTVRILPDLVTDKDAGDTLTLTRVWRGTTDYPILGDGERARIQYVPSSGFDYSELTYKYSVTDDHGGTDTSTFVIKIGPCPDL